VPVFSINKGPSLSLWKLPVLVLCCSTRRSPASSSAKLPRWWFDGDLEAGVAFFNKQRLHRCCRCVLWFSSSLTCHGGEEDGGKLQATYGGGGCWGNFDTEHIHAVSIFAAAILC
jgi:hypothetical protein